MAYLVSAYAIVLLAFAGYLLWLHRRRAQLRAELRADPSDRRAHPERK